MASETPFNPFERRMLSTFYQWIDLFWIPVGLLATRRGQYVLTTGFIVACVICLRMQLELMSSIHKEDGVLGFVDMGLYERGLFVYGFFIALFLILAHFSPRTTGVVFLAASITIFITGFCVSMLAMVL
jgi:hypothetical protein